MSRENVFDPLDDEERYSQLSVDRLGQFQLFLVPQVMLSAIPVILDFDDKRLQVGVGLVIGRRKRCRRKWNPIQEVCQEGRMNFQLEVREVLQGSALLPNEDFQSMRLREQRHNTWGGLSEDERGLFPLSGFPRHLSEITLHRYEKAGVFRLSAIHDTSYRAAIF
ncbi:hypothetical protein [Rhizobium etli]|uniref:hypothetical protein n=1 Tax=Rhizobium etli TaxID=29449 RepID=UPI0012DB3F8D|nr:hypothetical protein [Rhizobium etli]